MAKRGRPRGSGKKKRGKKRGRKHVTPKTKIIHAIKLLQDAKKSV
jgi:hypothetical protein